MKYDSLGDRMKSYEKISRMYLTRRLPCIIRLDGKAFHSFTKGFQKPFDKVLMKSMWDTAIYLCQNIQGCQIAYTQSDEITLLLTDYEELETSAWFDKNVQKMVSVSASMATLAFNKSFRSNLDNFSSKDITNYKIDQDFYDYLNLYKNRIDMAMFDSRVFTLPKEEVCNCFIWRQQDATRNSIQMVGQANFSHKELQERTCNDIQDMLWQEKNINWNDFPVSQKRGACIIKEYYNKGETTRSRWVVDYDIPIFTQDREYIEKYI